MNKLLRKALVFLTIFAVVFSMAGCGDTSWIVKVDDVTVNAGMYIYYQGAGYTAGVYELSEEDSTYYYYYLFGYSLLDETVNGQSMSDYMSDYAVDMCKQYVVIQKLFEELGLELTETELANIETSVANTWESYSETYEAAGISEDTVRKVAEITMMEEDVFNAYYEVGGLNGTTEDDIKDYLEDNYARIKYITFEFSESADDAIDEDYKAEMLEIANSYLERAEAGESMDDLIAEYDEILAAAEAEEEEDSEDETEDTEEEVEEVEVEEEVDEYANEYIISIEGTSPSEKFVNYVFTVCNVGEYTVIQDDTCFYLVERLDILERDDLYEANRDSYLEALFDEDYTTLINEKLATYEVEVNENSIKRYTAERALGMD
ncbi:MAG: hypothetical protein LUC38_02460 [Oscillospiraceae bacterium]|nr:hypothetical protein [Ruminococcus sp.]MCD8344809.1 hypothetical protein [Oscillospiraceae bacterium]